MLAIPIKTEKEINAMREGGKLLATVMRELQAISKPGTDSWELEEHFMNFCEENNAIPACKGYHPKEFPPYPTGLCLSFNEQSVHCFPVKGRKLSDGDLITIDSVIGYKNMYVDHAISFVVGKASETKMRLLQVTKRALDEAIKVIRPEIKVGVISNAMQNIVYSAGFSVLREYAGHGIGRAMHEPPEIPCYGKPSDGPKVKAGMTLAIEPLVCENSNVLEHNNYWETKTVDNGNFAQFEHTVLVTDNGYEVLTKI